MKKREKRKKKILKTILSVFVVVIVIAGVWYGLQVHSAHKLLRRIEDMSSEELLQEALAGKKEARVTVGVIKDGQAAYEVYGPDAAALEQTEYRYEIGSITKTMTAALIAQAIQEEKLSLTDTIDRYLELPAGKVYPTIESLLTHTSGLDGYYFEWSMLPYLVHPEKNPFQGITAEAVVQEYQETKLKEGKEYGFEYSNYGFALLGLMLEQIYDTDYTSLLNKYLQSDLGLKNTYVSNGDADFDGNWIWENDDAYISAGAVVSDITDMLLYAEAQLGGDPMLTMCHQALKQVNAADKWERMGGFGINEIGMSWMIDQENGIIWHNGATGMHTSYLGFCPEKNTAVVVLSNLSQNEDIETTTIGFKKLMEISR
ncbi:MAG: serine hydrolase domain-containing protein [Lachnospiraceae bacterium]|nr:serine hydrolase domain-containing protein [Lachnospiraceae bacterium]